MSKLNCNGLEWSTVIVHMGSAGMAKRVVYVIDHSGTVRWVWERSREQPQPDYDLVLTVAKKVAETA